MNFTFRPTPISLKTALSAVFFGLVVGVVLILATGNNPIEIYQALLRGACGSRFALCSSIRWTVPLLSAVRQLRLLLKAAYSIWALKVRCTWEALLRLSLV